MSGRDVEGSEAIASVSRSPRVPPCHLTLNTAASHDDVAHPPSSVEIVAQLAGPQGAVVAVGTHDETVIAGGDDIEVPETPLPLAQMAALLFVLINESLCANMLFPIVGLLVAKLESESPNDAGYQTGVLVGVYQLGQVVSSKIWGRFSDQYGRRPAMFIGAAGSGLCMLLFGLSTTFWGCVLMRFMHGVVNGNILVAKATIADITDKTNEAKGFTLISFAWGCGSMVGPAIGGFLYEPGSSSFLRRVGFTPGGPFDQRPALLPSLLITVYSLIAASLVVVALKESNRAAKPIDVLVQKIRRLMFYWWMRFRQRIASSSQERAVLSQDEDAAAAAKHVQEDMQPILRFGYREAISSQRTRNPLILYALLSAFDIIFCEVFPLWLIATRSVGGVGLDHSQIGTIIITGSVPTLLSNVAFPSVRKYFHNDVLLWRWIAALAAALTISMSFLGSSSFESVMVPLIAWFILRIAPNCWCFSMSFLIISRSSPREHVGAMNGIGQSAGALTRSLIPPLIAPLFAWSIDPSRFVHFFPFDHTLAFWIAGALLIATIPLASKIDIDILMSPRSTTSHPASSSWQATPAAHCDEVEYPSTPMASPHGKDEMMKQCSESSMETLSL